LKPELLIFLALPAVIVLISRKLFPHKITVREGIVQFVIISILVVITYSAGMNLAGSDTEILNTYISSKDREHSTYQRSYPCNCNGKGNCQTCYETRYTVKWTARTPIEDIVLKELDRSTSRVYDTEDPDVYTNCTVGEPAAIPHTFFNNIKAAPSTLFNLNIDFREYTGKVPNYPKVYSYYKYNRVINVDSKISKKDIESLNTYLNNELKSLGLEKEVNILVILTGIDNPEYRYAVESAWLGGKKNDVVLFIGLDGYTVTWSSIMTFALNFRNEIFQAEAESDFLHNSKEFDVKNISNLLIKNIRKWYARPNMSSFDYLKDITEPTLGVMVAMFVVSVLGSIGLSYVFYKGDY